MLPSTLIHPVHGKAILDLLMRFLRTAEPHTDTVTPLGFSTGYTAAAGARVTCLRVFDGSFKRKD